MRVELNYGHDRRLLGLPDRAEVQVLRPEPLPALVDPAAALLAALDSPLGAPCLEDQPAPQSVAVAVPDTTRPLPTRLLLPVLLKRLFTAYPALAPADVTILVGAGLHEPLDAVGLARVVPPEAALGARVVSHDARRAEFVDYGRTSRGTPLLINALFARADLKISLGQIDPHQFVGFTGGAKGAVVGLASARTIEASHGLMFDDRAQAGIIDGNPVREDLTEAGRLMGLDLAVNAVLNAGKEVGWLGAGEPEAVMRAGALVCARTYGLGLKDKFDLVVASCGGHPKDICLYQAQKGLNLASQALRPGGKILLLAACEEGLGDEVYLDYVRRFATPAEVLADFKKLGFKMGAHKAFLFARTQVKHEVVLDTELSQAELTPCHLVKGQAQEVIGRWVAAFPGRPRLAVVPAANATYFYPLPPAPAERANQVNHHS
jgi:nickel-dependent lactate racemase